MLMYKKYLINKNNEQFDIIKKSVIFIKQLILINTINYTNISCWFKWVSLWQTNALNSLKINSIKLSIIIL